MRLTPDSAEGAGRKLRFLVLAALAAVAAPAMANTFPGRVIGVMDGDTILVLTPKHEQIKVRLGEIDAPERGQSYGERSKQNLSALCYKRAASVTVIDIDQYGRTVGKVECDGVNANHAQVENGMAWVYRRYARDASLFDKETAARSGKLGLWGGDSSPTAPWEWRKAKRLPARGGL